MSLLQIDGLKKSYRTPEGELQPVIDIASFVLEAGRQVALQGSSGSGKTTFLNLIAGILKADEGRISLAGVDLTALSEGQRDVQRAQDIGYVFQSFNLLPAYTALENVQLGMLFGSKRSAGEGREYARTLLTRLGLQDRLNYKPTQLSVGQQQRVALARALANSPRLVLADEPTGNLDQRHALEALTLIREICEEQGAALLLVSHDSLVLSKFQLRFDLSELNRASSAALGAAQEGQ